MIISYRLQIIQISPNFSFFSFLFFIRSPIRNHFSSVYSSCNLRECKIKSAYQLEKYYLILQNRHLICLKENSLSPQWWAPGPLAFIFYDYGLMSRKQKLLWLPKSLSSTLKTFVAYWATVNSSKCFRAKVGDALYWGGLVSKPSYSVARSLKILIDFLRAIFQEC